MGLSPYIPHVNTAATLDPRIHERDDEQLRVLSILYLVYAVLDALGALYVGGVVALSGARFSEAAQLLVFLFVLMLFGLAYLTWLASRALRQRDGTTVIYLAAAIACLSFPLGTLLGAATFVVMTRPSVKALFAR